LSAFFVARAKVPDLEVAATNKEQPSAISNLREGAKYLSDHPAQRSLLFLKSGALFSGGIFVIVTVFADQLFADPTSPLGKKSLLMGVMLAGRGFGALVMPFLVERVTGSSVRGVGRALLFAFPLCIVFFSAFSQAPSVWIAFACLFLAHGGTSTIWVGSSQLFQVTVPNRVLGRVLSVDFALVTLSVAAINTIVAFALARSMPPRLVALGVGLLFSVPFFAWLRAYRRYLPTLEKEKNQNSRSHDDNLGDLGRGSDASGRPGDTETAIDPKG
jgi:MFS family permease